MALVTEAYTSDSANEELVAAVDGKVIRVLRLHFAAEQAGTLVLKSDPGGASDTELVPTQYLGNNRIFDFELAHDYALATERGKALGFTYFTGVPNKGHTIMVWYELVD